MHELSIAVSLIKAAEERAREEGAARISRLNLKIGPLSGVVPHALASAFELASEATMAEGAVLEIEDIPIVVFCARCDLNVKLDALNFMCSICGTPSSEIRSGRELELTSIEIE